MDSLFTLYEADDKHQLIGWGPMPAHHMGGQAFELILEGDTHLSHDQLRAEWNLFFAQGHPNKHSNYIMNNPGGHVSYMTVLCEFLNEHRDGYRHFFTEEEVQ